MENNLPAGWAWFNMLDIIDYEGGSQPPKKVFIYEPKKGFVRLIQIRDYGDKPFPTYVPDSTKLKKVEKDDLLIARYGGSSANDSLGRICSGIEGAYNVALAKVIFPKQHLNTSFVRYLLSGPWFKERLNSLSRSCQTGFNRDDLQELYFPLPPLAEQHRIVANLDDLFEKYECNKIRLEKIPTILKRFRQSVLAAAVSGRLTNINKEIEKISLGELIDDLKYGTAEKSEKDKKGTPILRIPNIGDDGRINLNDLKFAELQKKELEKLALKEGDILLIRSNGSVSLLGKAAIVSSEQVGLAYAGYLIRIRCNLKKVLPEFLNHILSSYDVRMQIEIPSRSSSGVNNINSDEVRALQIPVFTIDEQKEIVKRLEHLFAFADKLERRYIKAKAIFDKVPQSILAKAFRGELEVQDPNDEPASMLLERIKEDKEKLKAVKKRKQK